MGASQPGLRNLGDRLRERVKDVDLSIVMHRQELAMQPSKQGAVPFNPGSRNKAGLTE